MARVKTFAQAKVKNSLAMGKRKAKAVQTARQRTKIELGVNRGRNTRALLRNQTVQKISGDVAKSQENIAKAQIAALNSQNLDNKLETKPNINKEQENTQKDNNKRDPISNSLGWLN